NIHHQQRSFEHHTAETCHNAEQRLKTLFFECVAELHKASARLDEALASSEVSSAATESMVAAARLRRSYEWKLFLCRLEEDCCGLIRLSQLPVEKPQQTTVPSTSLIKPTDALLSNEDAISQFLKRKLGLGGSIVAAHNKPVLQLQQLVVVKMTGSMAAVKTRIESGKVKPRFVTGDSARQTWAELMESYGELMPVSSSSSSRRARRLPTRSAYTISTNSNRSKFRQLQRNRVVQFPLFDCDLMLSSSCVLWLLRRPQINDHGAGSPSSSPILDLHDCNVYFSLQEYEARYAESFRRPLSSDQDGALQRVNKSQLAAIRRALQSLNAILDQCTSLVSEPSSASLPASAIAGHVLAVIDNDDRRNVFVRASLLQLLQTTYYSTNFVKQLAPEDATFLETHYPTAVFGAGVLSTLYVPVSSTSSRTLDTKAEFTMHPIDDRGLHELLLMYIARATKPVGSTDTNSGKSSTLESLAEADAVTELFPTDAVQVQTEAGEQTFKTNQLGLIHHATELLKATSAGGNDDEDRVDAVVVEYSLSDQQHLDETEINRRRTSTSRKKREHLEAILGSRCFWRSCLDKGSTDESPCLCHWHRTLRDSLNASEAAQYLPSSFPFSTLKTWSIDQTIQKSSSLLEEVSSRHLIQSLRGFFDHVVGSLSTSSFEVERMARPSESDTIDGGMKELEKAKAYHKEQQSILVVVEQMLEAEQATTRELRQLQQISTSTHLVLVARSPFSIAILRVITVVYPGIEMTLVESAMVELQDLNSSIRTNDLELRLRLSLRKRDLVRRRREDEEARLQAHLPRGQSMSSLSTASSVDADFAAHAPVHDVIHILRKGRRSLRQQQGQAAHHLQRPRSGTLPLSNRDIAATNAPPPIKQPVAKVGGKKPSRLGR
ncbi:TPA: hypothetical protein N0F65_006090, partial [Lagenidium giganteum]